MSEKKLTSQEERALDVREKALAVKDLIQYLSGLASLTSAARTGNPELSKALRILTRALKPYSDRQVLDLIAILGEKQPSESKRTTPKRPKVPLPPGLETISHGTIEEILLDEKYTKAQLIEVGVSRFGISHSRLSRIKRADVADTIRAALDHERSLGVISHEARRGGMKRSS